MPCKFFDIFCARNSCFSGISRFSVFAAIILQFSWAFLFSLIAVKPCEAT